MAELIPLQSNRGGDEHEVTVVSIVIPLYNEQRFLQDNADSLARIFDDVVGPGRWSFIFVENGSADATASLADAVAARHPPSRALHLLKPNYGMALKTGLQAATTKWVFLLDIEQWDLPFITWAWRHRESYDALIASKRADATINHQHFYRRLLSCGLNGLLQILLQYTGTDTHGPKLLDRASLQAIIDACELDRGQYDTELVLRAIRGQKRIIEAPSEYRELRPNRNWMVKKIFWNIWALARLVKVMKHVPYEGLARYYRVAREDVLAEAERQREPAPESRRV